MTISLSTQTPGPVDATNNLPPMQFDDQEEMGRDLIRLARTAPIEQMVNVRITNKRNDIDQICDSGLASLKEDTSMLDVGWPN